MRDATIARNYAQTLLALANKAKGVDAFGVLINGMADAVRENVVLRRFLAAPQVAEADKRGVLRKALEGKAPNTFVLFVEKARVEPASDADSGNRDRVREPR